MAEAKWYDEYDNIALTARYLADVGASSDVVAYFVEKPWKYEDEYKERRRLGTPWSANSVIERRPAEACVVGSPATSVNVVLCDRRG